MRVSCLCVALVLLAAAAMGCAAAPTQLIVVVDTDLAIPTELDEVRITVTSDTGMMETEAQSLTSAELLPLTLAVVPEGESLGPIEVVAEGRRRGAAFLSRRARVTLVRGETRMLRLHLVAACVGTTCASDSQSCGESGCAPVDIATLPTWPGTPPRLHEPDASVGLDAGRLDAAVPDAPGLDAPGLDAPGLDGGPPDAAPEPDAWAGCATAADCDDGVPCTMDDCSGERCVHLPNDSACSDGEVCTDDRCDLTLGCVRDPNDAPCDDGTFCNGFDRCAGGSCTTHTGDPCASPTVCDESMSRCLGCRTGSDCPAPSMGTWLACSYADGCDESGTRSRTNRTYACSGGSCVPSDMIETEPCTRDTDGSSCGTGSCGGYGACNYSNTCDESASRTRTCTDLTCVTGVCRSQNRDETMACTRDTDGTSCAATSCGAYGGCDYGGTCDESAMQSRTCMDFACVTGSCASTSRSETTPCTRDTDGASCGSTMCGAYGACDYADTCDESATQYRTCTDQTCAASSCGGSTPRMESQACTRDTDGTSCGAGQRCTAGSCVSCAPTLSGSAGTAGGGSYFTNVSGSSNRLNFTDGSTGMVGTITASGGVGVTFSGGAALGICIWQVHGSGNTLRFVDWNGTDMATITVAGATVSGSVAPPCTDTPYGCFPPCLTRVTGSGSTLSLEHGGAASGTITFGCP